MSTIYWEFLFPHFLVHQMVCYEPPSPKILTLWSWLTRVKLKKTIINTCNIYKITINLNMAKKKLRPTYHQSVATTHAIHQIGSVKQHKWVAATFKEIKQKYKILSINEKNKPMNDCNKYMQHITRYYKHIRSTYLSTKARSCQNQYAKLTSLKVKKCWQSK